MGCIDHRVSARNTPQPLPTFDHGSIHSSHPPCKCRSPRGQDLQILRRPIVLFGKHVDVALGTRSGLRRDGLWSAACSRHCSFTVWPTPEFRALSLPVCCLMVPFFIITLSMYSSTRSILTVSFFFFYQSVPCSVLSPGSQ